MAAYAIFAVDEELDDEKMQQYRATARETLMGRNARILSLPTSRLETVEGEPLQTLVIIEFPSFDVASEWYHSEQYQSHAQLRQSATHGRAFLVDGVDVPLG